MNDSWKNWIIGIAASLFVVGAGMNYNANLSMAEKIGKLTATMSGLQNTIENTSKWYEKRITAIDLRVLRLENKN